jgi:hypothetical protein
MICFAREIHPPVEPPVSSRAHGWPMTRKRDSTAGMSSCMIASPNGPLLAEFTPYESS